MKHIRTSHTHAKWTVFTHFSFHCAKLFHISFIFFVGALSSSSSVLLFFVFEKQKKNLSIVSSLITLNINFIERRTAAYAHVDYLSLHFVVNIIKYYYYYLLKENAMAATQTINLHIFNSFSILPYERTTTTDYGKQLWGCGKDDWRVLRTLKEQLWANDIRFAASLPATKKKNTSFNSPVRISIRKSMRMNFGRILFTKIFHSTLVSIIRKFSASGRITMVNDINNNNNNHSTKEEEIKWEKMKKKKK